MGVTMIAANPVSAGNATIGRCLARIEEVQGVRTDLLPVDIADITVLNLQRAIKAAIDLALHVVASEDYGIPESTAYAFTMLEHRGILDPVLADRLRRLVEFRNRSIYDFTSVDAAVVDQIVQHHLGDLRALGARIVEAFGLADGLSGR